MRDPIDAYLENILCYADLAANDERSVRMELGEHLHSLAAESHVGGSDVGGSLVTNPKEIYAMLSDQFGSPKTVGRGIAAAKGRVRTYLKKMRRRLPLQIGIALVLVFAVRFSLAQVFYVAGDGVSPVVPKGSRVMVYKLANSFNPGDVIVYRYSESELRLGIIDRQTSDDHWLVERNQGSQKVELPREKIVGRVFLNTR